MTGLSPASSSENVSGRSSKNYYETLSEETAEANNNNAALAALTPTSQLSKKDRKKLKKLKKRAALVLVESERSGLLTRSEYEEYQALIQLENDDQHNNNNNNDNNHALSSDDAKEQDSASENKKSPDSSSTISSFPSAYPSINLRTKCIGIEKVEGSTHRDLLSWLLQQKFDRPQQQQQQQSKKRRREDSGGNNEEVAVALPHWASAHNPGTCEQVAVLEIHLPHEKIGSYCKFLESCRSKSENKDSESKSENNDTAIEREKADRSFSHSQIGVATKWFQGHMPKSMSETLLYFSNAKKEHKIKKTEDVSAFPSRTDFIERLETMLISPEEMNEQGYPVGLSSSTVNNSEADDNVVSRKEKLQSPDSISLEKAKNYVAAFGVRVEHQNEEDESPYISTLPVASSTGVLDKESNGDKIPGNDDECPVRVLGLDCEMVLTTVGSELARVTLLEFDEFVEPKTNSKTTVLLDCLVRPDNRIVDYLTKHSGITPALLEPISTRLQQVQCALASYLTPNDILIGHSLENDLRALHYIHPRIVDTSMIFRPSDQNKRFKFSLRHLSATLLKKTIQTGSHCSEEDAQTALDLALLKALKGDDLRVPGFGDNQRQSLLRQKFVKESVAAFIGPNHWLETHITRTPNGAHALNYDSPNDCKKAMLAWITNKRKAQLIWSKIELGNETCSTESSLKVFKSIVVSL
jgi:DNA polymerase III epsilon subunit-like protein